MLAGVIGGCKTRIAHSHNTKCEQIRADRLLRPLFYRIYTEAMACGVDAGKWLFGERPFNVLKNGRNIWFSMVLNLKSGLFIETVIGQQAFMILGIFYT